MPALKLARGGEINTDDVSLTSLSGVLKVGAVDPSLLTGAGASVNNVLAWDGTAWAPAPAGGASAATVEVDLGSTPKTSGRFTITDAAISATSKVMVWQAPGPYTGKGTLADEAAMQPVNVVAVLPASGSCTVWWETPAIVSYSPVIPDGRRDSPSTVVGFDPRYPYVAYEARRIGKVEGNVKFSYMILA